MNPTLDRRLAAAAAAVIFATIGFAIGFKTAEPALPDDDSVDVGFLQDMVDHHDQAVVMSAYMMRPDSGADSTVRTTAFEIVMQQRYEIGLMHAWLRDWGYDLGETDRLVMGWMGMEPVPLSEMHGMQSESQMQTLEDARGRDADGEFLDMMIDHHQGAVDMGDYVKKHATDEKVRSFGERVARIQRSEILELKALQRRLGLPVS